MQLIDVLLPESFVPVVLLALVISDVGKRNTIIAFFRFAISSNLNRTIESFFMLLLLGQIFIILQKEDGEDDVTTTWLKNNGDHATCLACTTT